MTPSKIRWILAFTLLLVSIAAPLYAQSRQNFEWVVARRLTVRNTADIEAGGLTVTAGGVAVTAGGVAVTAGGLDINGTCFDLDADADTSLCADTDDQIDVEINGADDFAFKANSFELASGSIVDINGAADGVVLDADADTSLSSPTDDQIDIEIGGADEMVITASQFDLNDTVLNQDQDTENIGQLPTWLSIPITTTDKTLATIADGEIWVVHDVFVKIATNYNCTGDDCALVIGDSDDADGFTVLADAEMQAADTELTGMYAGWQGFQAATRGVYLDEVTTNGSHRMVYAPSGATDAILLDIQGTSPAGGTGTVYIYYTRLQ